MRFSSVFQLPLSHRADAQPVEGGRVVAPAAAEPAAPAYQDLPDDLDQRVRMIGEWQLGEG
jgi:hypothetical protein